MKCPVCDTQVEDQKIFCPCCGWEFKPDIIDLSPKEKALYDARLSIARKNWGALQGYRRFEQEARRAPSEEPGWAAPEPGGARRKILFCSDLYASSDHAFAAALDLAERSGAELIIFHVLQSRHRYSGQVIIADGETWDSEEVYDKLNEKLKEYYFCRIEQENLAHVRIAVKGGIPWLEILRFARKERVDRIVMGPYTIRDHRIGFDLEKPHLGENAQQVILQASCPVCIVTSPEQRLSFEDEEVTST
jgi:nucleotide-binding universal stress UspA family protein